MSVLCVNHLLQNHGTRVCGGHGPVGEPMRLKDGWYQCDRHGSDDEEGHEIDDTTCDNEVLHRQPSRSIADQIGWGGNGHDEAT